MPGVHRRNPNAAVGVSGSEAGDVDVGPASTPAPVELRIGTIEVVTAPAPRSGAAPDPLARYALLRSYRWGAT